MRISDWSSDVCSSDLAERHVSNVAGPVGDDAGAAGVADAVIDDAGVRARADRLPQRLRGGIGAGAQGVLMAGTGTPDIAIGAVKGCRVGAVLTPYLASRSDRRRVGKECVRTCRS